jgi:hypothetical protein
MADSTEVPAGIEDDELYEPRHRWLLFFSLVTAGTAIVLLVNGLGKGLFTSVFFGLAMGAVVVTAARWSQFWSRVNGLPLGRRLLVRSAAAPGVVLTFMFAFVLWAMLHVLNHLRGEQIQIVGGGFFTGSLARARSSSRKPGTDLARILNARYVGDEPVTREGGFTYVGGEKVTMEASSVRIGDQRVTRRGGMTYVGISRSPSEPAAFCTSATNP